MAKIMKFRDISSVNRPRELKGYVGDRSFIISDDETLRFSATRREWQPLPTTYNELTSKRDITTYSPEDQNRLLTIANSSDPSRTKTENIEPAPDVVLLPTDECRMHRNGAIVYVRDGYIHWLTGEPMKETSLGGYPTIITKEQFVTVAAIAGKKVVIKETHRQTVELKFPNVEQTKKLFNLLDNNFGSRGWSNKGPSCYFVCDEVLTASLLSRAMKLCEQNKLTWINISIT